ncbi:MAG: BatA and WFA domain-containing protein [Proteobacteria bacterium]|nr:BatA and WFA domain-containing protein [Pseudomonadota bacterium]
MIFNGYTFQTLLPFLAVLAVIIAILYLIRVRRRAVTMPYIGLWREVLEKSSHRRFHDWIKRFISFLICMLIIALIAVALMDPREEEDNTARRHAVFIVDTSASMAADSGLERCKSRFDCAIQDTREHIDHMKPTDRAVIINAAGIVSAVSGPFQSDKDALQKTLSTLNVQSSTLDLAKALELAVHLSADRDNPEIYLFTDGQFENAEELSQTLPRNVAFEQITYGKPSGNLSITAFNVRRYIANRLGFEVFFSAHNDFNVPVTARLSIHTLADDEQAFDPSREHETIVEKTLTIASGSSELRLYNNLTLKSSRMAATLEIVDPPSLVDPMPMDDVAYAKIPDYAKPNIACITPGNLYLEAALLLNENYRVSFIKPTQSDILKDDQIDLAKLTSKYDIAILDNSYRNLPTTDMSDWQGRVIWINPALDNSPFKSKEVQSPVIERVNSKHPISRWLSLKNLNISRANVFTSIKNDDLVMRAIEGPLMATKNADNQRILAIGFSLVESDLIFRVALPVLFINAIDWLMDENSEPLRGFPTGNAWHIAVTGNASHVDVTRPDGTVTPNLPVYDHSASFYGESSGFYRISSPEKTFEFAANFANETESKLSRQPATIQGRIHMKPTLMDEDEDEESSWLLTLLSKLPNSSQYIWVLALLIAMGILTIEWITYHRRWTV